MSKIIDKTVDTLEKLQSPASRAGHSTERVAKLSKAGVDSEVIALQMTKNSKTGQLYTKDDILTLKKLYNDCEIKVAITRAQTTALMNDQNKNEKVADRLKPALQ